jgi:hypothetical protein
MRPSPLIILIAFSASASAHADAEGDLARARALAKKGAWDEARQLLRRVVKDAPKHGWALTELSLAELKAGDPTASIAAATQATEVPGEHVPAAKYNLSLAWEAKGDRQKAGLVLADYGFVTPAIADRAALLGPPPPQPPAWTGPAEAFPSVAAWCKAFRAARAKEKVEPGIGEGPSTWKCSQKLTSPSPVVPTLGRVGVVSTDEAHDYNAYEVAHRELFLAREVGKRIELVHFIQTSSDKSGSQTVDRVRWETQDVIPGGAPELIVTIRASDSTDFNDPRLRRGSKVSVDELAWVVGLDDAGRLAAFGPVPISQSESSEPGFDDESGTEIPLGKPWKQAWRFDVRWEAGAVTVGELPGKPVPQRAKHRLGRFAVRFMSDR